MEVSIIEGNARIQTKGPLIGSLPVGDPSISNWMQFMSMGQETIKGLNKISLRFYHQDSLAEWSKAPDLGSGPKGRGFKSHSCQFSINPLFWSIHTLRSLLLLFFSSFSMHQKDIFIRPFYNLI